MILIILIITTRTTIKTPDDLGTCKASFVPLKQPVMSILVGSPDATHLTITQSNIIEITCVFHNKGTGWDHVPAAQPPPFAVCLEDF